jgi:uncharacterized membrane protein
VKPPAAELDQRIERTIGNLLRIGVTASATVVVVGAIVYLGRHGSAPAAYQMFHGEPSELRSVWGILRSTRSFSGRAIIQLGLLLLIATPVARVAFSIWGFAARKDRTYVVVSTLVFCALLYSLLGPDLGVR